MAATTMHFGPEWMRAKQQTPARHQPPPSPPLQTASASNPLGASSYSALVTPATQEPEKRDDSRPFRYTKEEMLRIYKEGGGRGGLNLEVERWEGIVRDVGGEPAGLRDMNEAEKKLFAGPLNSELRRRQSTDLMNTLSSPSDRQRSNHTNSTTNSTMRYGPFMGRRRDSTDQPPLTLPRKLSISNTQCGALAPPRDVLPSPRNRMGAFGSGFDGVLNSGDSWSRRRPSISVSGAGGGLLAKENKDDDSRGSEIKEEEESAGHRSASADDSGPTTVMGLSFCLGSGVSPSDTTPDVQVSSSELDSASQSMADVTLDPQNQSNTNPQALSTTNTLPSGPPPGLTDPASIEWSYLDPQGQVQGPFMADLMQKWFDEGYFTPDLLMKRTHVDSDWVAVGVLERRATGGKMFLSQISTGPPGLAVHTESPKSYSPAQEQNTFNGYQPVPTRALRTTLDSYLNGSSPIDSPSSSLGGRFGNNSPDPSAFGSRAGNNVYPSDPNIVGRGFGGRVALQDSMSDARALSHTSLGRVPTIDTFNAYSGSGDGSPWSAGPGHIVQGFHDSEPHPYSNGFNGVGPSMMGNSLPVNPIHPIHPEHYGDTTYGSTSNLGGRHDSSTRQLSDVNGVSFDGSGSHLTASAQFSQSPSISYTPSRNHQSGSPFKDPSSQSSEAPNVAQTPTSAVQPNGASPWRTRSFENPIAPSPIVPPARPHIAEWVIPQPPQPMDPSPWLVASIPVVDDAWREMPGHNSLTFSNLGQHNKLQEQEEGLEDVVASPVEDSVPVFPNILPSQTELANAVSANGTTTTPLPVPVTSAVTSSRVQGTQGSAGQKARRKSTARDVLDSAPKVVPPPPSGGIKESPTSTLQAGQLKPAWAVDDDSKKQKGVGVTMSLREIQEAEVKKAEARKAAEKERERLARANTSANGASATDESQPFTSWGLPTSQAGARNVATPKETLASISTSMAPAVPVWTNASSAPATRKTMKEIQEEEEKRKKLVTKESVASAAARRGYAETTVKVVPSAQSTGGPWTTVGPNGKSNPPLAGVPRPTVNTSTNNSTLTATIRPNGPAARQGATTTAKVVAPRVEDFPITPSHDFLKWLGDSLKGLNSSANLEEITSMLLSFPLDPDQSTIEIISDLIYASSTTLDGRRFASEYVSKRKADAAARRGAGGTSGANKSASIADVVKTQPKPVQQEWGFKVVNKKKKGVRT